MNDDSYSGELHEWIELGIEARMVAMILGEASDFEVDELERLMEDCPELQIFKRRLEVVHGLLGEAVKPKDDAQWRLSPKRRAEVMKAIGAGPKEPKWEEPEAPVIVPLGDSRERRTRKAGRKVALMAAACLIISLLLAPFFMTRNWKQESESMSVRHFNMDTAESRPTITTYAAPATRKSEAPARHEALVSRTSETDAREDARGHAEGGFAYYQNGRKKSESVADLQTDGADVQAKLSALKDRIGTRSRGLSGEADRSNFGETAPGDETGTRPGDPTEPSSGPSFGPVAGERFGTTREAPPAPSARLRTAPAPDRLLSVRTKPSASSPPAPANGKPATKAGVVAALVDKRESDFDLAIPVPDVPLAGDMPVAGALFGNSDKPGSPDDFGDGWGFGSGGGDSGTGGGGVAPQESKMLSGPTRTPAPAGVATATRTAGSLPLGGIAKDANGLVDGERDARWESHYRGGRPLADDAELDAEVGHHSVDAIRNGSGRTKEKPNPAEVSTGGFLSMNLKSENQLNSLQKDVTKEFKEADEDGDHAPAFAGRVATGTTRGHGWRKAAEATDDDKFMSYAKEVRAMRRDDGRSAPGPGLAVVDGVDAFADSPLETTAKEPLHDPEAPPGAPPTADAQKETRTRGTDETRSLLLRQADQTWSIEMAKEEEEAEPDELRERLQRPAEENARHLEEKKKRLALQEMEKSASEEAFSTFSLHVSDVSFKLALAALAKGEWPEPPRVRVEEFVNAFDYGDPAPTQDQKVACRVEQAAHPFMQQRNLVRISMRTAAVGRASGTPLRLTVLLDNSGSMERADRVESVQRAFQLLAAQLNPQDAVTLISFARTPRLLRDNVPGDQAHELARVIAETPSEGGTNLEEALRLAVEKASERMLQGAQNRIILLTDGAANLGNAEPEDLAQLVEEMRQKGISFDACGVGAEGLNDDVLEALTRKGDGRYYFLDRPEDADAGFAKQIAGALRPAARNVKVQVEFNPMRVGRYRLYGFEKHELKKEDFRNDSVDAAELAAEEAGVAIYQVEPLPDGEGHIGTVSVRFQDTSTGEMVEKLWTIPYESNPARLTEAASSMQLAASAAFLGEKLKGSPIGETVALAELSGVSRALQTVYPANARVGQLIDMIEKAREMTR